MARTRIGDAAIVVLCSGRFGWMDSISLCNADVLDAITVECPVSKPMHYRYEWKRILDALDRDDRFEKCIMYAHLKYEGEALIRCRRFTLKQEYRHDGWI